MLTYAFLKTWLDIIQALFSGLAALDITGNHIADSITLVTTYMFKANYFFPFATVFEILALWFYIEWSIMAFKIMNWVFDKIRGAG